MEGGTLFKLGSGGAFHSVVYQKLCASEQSSLRQFGHASGRFFQLTKELRFPQTPPRDRRCPSHTFGGTPIREQ